MATIQQLLDDINLRYRNTFTPDQKLVWMNEEQRELFETLELDSVPFSFSTVADQYLYPIPDGVEKDRIKVITYQINDIDFTEVPFRENDNRQFVYENSLFYTILENNFYFNIPTVPIDDRIIYIYLDSQPEDILSSALGIPPAVPLRYQELLKLGTLKRIAAARKDVIMYNNYDSDYQNKLLDMEMKMALQIPEFHSPVNVMPIRSRYRNGRRPVIITQFE